MAKNLINLLKHNQVKENLPPLPMILQGYKKIAIWKSHLKTKTEQYLKVKVRQNLFIFNQI